MPSWPGKSQGLIEHGYNAVQSISTAYFEQTIPENLDYLVARNKKQIWNCFKCLQIRPEERVLCLKSFLGRPIFAADVSNTVSTRGLGYFRQRPARGCAEDFVIFFVAVGIAVRLEVNTLLKVLMATRRAEFTSKRLDLGCMNTFN